jgi:DNA-binding Lrp family transcriptional regulator
MNEISPNEMKTLLMIFKDYSSSYNANNLSKKLNITSMGCLKILKNLEKKKILTSKQLGKARFYKIDFENSYAKTYLQFILENEAEESIPKIKKVVKEVRKLQENATIGIVFGSVLHKENYADVDLLLVLNNQKNEGLNKNIEEINKINIKKIHAVKQTEEDLIKNLKENNAVIISAIKEGIVAFGYEKIIQVIRNVS